MQDAKVIPLLFDLDFSDISGPLAQFQAKKLEKEGMREVIYAINQCTDKPSAEELIGRRFDPLWATFEESLRKVPGKEPSEKSKRTQAQILEELVSTVRSLEMRYRELGAVLEGTSTRSVRRRRIHPEFMFSLLHKEARVGTSGILLPMLAGVFRDEAPWISEILIDANRDLGDSSRLWTH